MLDEDEFDWVRLECRTKDIGSRQNKKKYPDEKMQAFTATICLHKKSNVRAAAGQVDLAATANETRKV
jgi:hypothetical protein